MSPRPLFLACALLAASSLAAAARDADVTTWSTDDVADWCATEAGFSNPAAAVTAIRTHGVDGRILLFVDDDDLKDEFGVTSRLERKKIIANIVALQDTDAETPRTAGGQSGAGLTFWEYRALDRKALFKITPLLTSAPRWALSLLNEDNWPPHALPPKPIGGWLEWILIPEYYLYLNSHAILGGLPGLLPLTLACNLVLRAFAIASAVFARDSRKLVGAVFGPFVVELGLGIFNAIYIFVLFPFIPYFVCNFFFLISVYVLPLFSPLIVITQIASSLMSKGKGTHKRS